MFESTNYISEYNVGDKFISFQYTNGKRFAQINVCQNKKVERNKKKIEVYQEGNAPLSLSFSTEDEAIEAFDLLNTALDTLRTNCQTANAVVTLFPNGIKEVTESRDLQADDAGYILGFTGGTIENPIILNIPHPSPLAVGESFVLVGDNVNKVIVSGDTSNLLQNEQLFFSTTSIEGTPYTFPLSSLFLEGKTILKYLYDKVNASGGGAYIPLSGTEVGSPVTGDIELVDGYSNIGFRRHQSDNNYDLGITMDDAASYLTNIDNNSGFINQIQVAAGNSGISIYTNNPLSRGMSGSSDFTHNITDLDYTQKKYVDSAIAANSGGGDIFITKTKAEIDTLISTNALVKGATYKISGVHPTLYNDGTNSGTTIILKAISENVLETQGTGIFYNPKYNQAVDGFGIWDNKMYGTFSTIVGTFDYQNKETVTADNGATGILLADGMIQYVSGNWSSATSITGDVSSATANVADFVSPSYAVNDKVIWGGYSWTNVNGNVGTSTDVLNLDSEWSKDVYNTTNYNLAYDVIEYDYANDLIVRRYNKEANIDVKCSKAQYDYFMDNGFGLHPISVQQWGNNFDISLPKGQFNIICNNGYNESVNFIGSYQQNLTFGSGSGQYNLTFGSGSYQQNLTFGSGSGQSNLTLGSSSYQSNLTFGSGSYQYNLTIGSDSYQYNLTFGSGSFQENLTFGNNSSQYNLTFGSGSRQFDLTFGNNSSQYNLTFGSGSYQSNLTLGSSSYQTNLTFGDGSRLNYNSQVISSNMEYINFNTKYVTVPDLSAATLLFDGNVKEVYQRPDDALKIRYYNNSDALVIANIAY